MAAFLAMMTSCEKNAPVDPDSQPEKKAPLVMTFQDFITPDDVQLISSDTTSISVSAAFAKKMGIKEFNDRPVTIWRSIGTVPFVRIITGSKVEKDKIILTTIKGEFSDMFENLDMSLETSLYVNKDYESKVATRAGTSYDVDDESGKYIDASGVYHPAVIIFEEESPVLKSIQTKSGEARNYFTAEELLEDNASFDIISLRTDFLLDFIFPKDEQDKDQGGKDEEGNDDEEDFNPNDDAWWQKYFEAAKPEKDDDNKRPVGVAQTNSGDVVTKASTDPKIHITGKIGVVVKLSAYADVSVRWFSLQSFETGVKGEVELSAKVSVGIEKQIKKEWEKMLVSLGEVTSVFWVGPIPVPYTVGTSLKQKMNANANASLKVYMSAKYKKGFEKGLKYTSDSGWTNTSKEGTSISSFNFDGLIGAASLKAETGTFYEVKIFLAGSAGPIISIGPKLSAEAQISATILDPKVVVDARVGAYVGLSGEIGAKVQFLGYTLAKWSTEFYLFKLKLLEAGLTFTYDERGWTDLQAKWDSVVNKDSSEWEWGEKPAETKVPYRLPDPEMNF